MSTRTAYLVGRNNAWLSVARDVSDHVIFLDDGKLVEMGTPADFFLCPRTKRARKFLTRYTA